VRARRAEGFSIFAAGFNFQRKKTLTYKYQSNEKRNQNIMEWHQGRLYGGD
jgi:hypothetical protein